MGHHIAASIGTATKLPSQYDRRHASRTPTLFSLFYSYMESGQMLIGDGVVTDLSSNGIGIRGNRSVAPGLEVALSIDLPGMDKPFAISQSRVSWTEGYRFGVEMKTLTLEEKNHLRFFL
ncbi:MAG: PilZ domain-containing protein [Nitrospira sp.]|nr:PilZ domain-containing protein [Nitrospira sp.]TKB74667.1 MAG: PilZ domain-containing protein [Nitrospira sp.]